MENTPQKRYYLSIDAGTQSIRSAIVDNLGQVLDIEKIDIEPYFSTQPGWAEQHPHYYWEMLCLSSNALLNRQAKLKTELSAVSISTQRTTMINMDAQGKPIRPAILWLDERKAQYESIYPKPLEWILNMVGILPIIKDAFCKSGWNWLRQNEPETIQKTDKYLFLSGFFNYQLCGEYHESIANCVGYVPFDYVHHRWLPKGHFKRKPFDIPLEKLPKLFKPGEKLGQITAQAFAQTGIPEGLPLIAGASDKSAEVLGSGVIDNESIACFSLGTTATVQTVCKTYKEVDFLAPIYPSAISNRYNSEVMIYKGFWMVSWFRDEFGHLEKEMAKSKNVSPEALLNDFLTDVPAGCMGLMTQPYWGAGVRHPGIEAKGSMIGFGDVQTRPYIYKSIIEGLAFGLKEGLNRTEKKLHKKVTVLRLAGGGSQSDNIMQIMADVCNRPTERPHTFESTILGTAINMAVALNHYPSYEKAVEQMVRIGKRFEPDAAHIKLYDRLYREVYLKLYARLKPIYKSIMEITGYPKRIAG